MKQSKHYVPDETPDFKVRSALALSPGLWRMRNGDTAEIVKLLHLPYKDSAGKQQQFQVWSGRCVDCQTPSTWNLNGCYAAVGKHAYDIISPCA